MVGTKMVGGFSSPAASNAYNHFSILFGNKADLATHPMSCAASYACHLIAGLVQDIKTEAPLTQFEFLALALKYQSLSLDVLNLCRKSEGDEDLLDQLQKYLSPPLNPATSGSEESYAAQTLLFVKENPCY